MSATDTDSLRRFRSTTAKRIAHAVKACGDRAGALLLLIVASPFVLVTALAIKVDSRGPVFYRQERVGRGGRLFRVFKFRTMIEGAQFQGLGLEVARDDDRITMVGRLLRLSSLDEFPQLINVLRGEMSLVGPRPTLAAQVERYTPRQRRRLEVKPGLTGWAQVNGRNSLSWEDRIELDIWYVDNWSLPLDLRIIVRTPLALTNVEDVYGKDGVTKDLGEE